MKGHGVAENKPEKKQEEQNKKPEPTCRIHYLDQLLVDIHVGKGSDWRAAHSTTVKRKVYQRIQRFHWISPHKHHREEREEGGTLMN